MTPLHPFATLVNNPTLFCGIALTHCESAIPRNIYHSWSSVHAASTMNISQEVCRISFATIICIRSSCNWVYSAAICVFATAQTSAASSARSSLAVLAPHKAWSVALSRIYSASSSAFPWSSPSSRLFAFSASLCAYSLYTLVYKSSKQLAATESGLDMFEERKGKKGKGERNRKERFSFLSRSSKFWHPFFPFFFKIMRNGWRKGRNGEKRQERFGKRLWGHSCPFWILESGEIPFFMQSKTQSCPF